MFTFDWITVARAVHILSVVHWIGGLFVVTTIVLPAAKRMERPQEALAAFDRFERRFAAQARWSVALAGVSGGYMFTSSYEWHGLFIPSHWWLQLMIAVWLLFALMLFVLQPLFLHKMFRRYALENPKRAYEVAIRLHELALTASLLAIGAGVLGAHGAIG
jgi:uncharacterized membrane protein